MIVCLGWGSLIWDPRTLPVTEWHNDGPNLPIEFARISGDGRVTLIVDERSPPVPVFWTALKVVTLDQAIEALRERENAPNPLSIGRWPAAEEYPCLARIGEWAAGKAISGVVWTALKGGRPEHRNEVLALESIIAHVNTLAARERAAAAEYVRRTPEQIQTPFRAPLERVLGVAPPSLHRLLPRQFQAGIGRLFDRMIQPALGEFPVIDEPPSGLGQSMNEFLDRAERATSRLLALEVRRSLALTLAALFERQLAMVSTADALIPDEKGRVHALLAKVAMVYEIDLVPRALGEDLDELHLIGNVVRHGQGWSADRLRETAGHLWVKRNESQSAEVEIVVTDDDFRRYMRALVRFWGEADHEPGAVVVGPY